MTHAQRVRPLDGIRVLDLTAVWAGPKCTQILAYLGAEVLKVEAPARPDQLRGTRAEPRPYCHPGGIVRERAYDRVATFNSLNRRKRGITIDLHHPDGLAIFKRLVKMSDVVAENFSVGVMDRLGLTYDVLQPIRNDIIVLSMPGFGHFGPDSRYVSWAGVVEAMSGITNLIGYEDDLPIREGIGLPDPLAGVFGAAAVVTALQARLRTGQGQFIELAQSEALMSLAAIPLIDWQLNGRAPARNGNRHDLAAPQGVYPCVEPDTWIAITVRNDRDWLMLRTTMGEPAWATDERFDTIPGRLRARAEIDEALAAYTRGHVVTELARDLAVAGIPAGQVASTKDVNRDADLEARRAFEIVDHDSVGPYRYFTPIGVRFAHADLSESRGAPTFGQDNRYVLQDLLGLSSEEIDHLEREKVIAREPLA